VVFGGWGSDATKSFNFYSKRHILDQIRIIEAILRDDRLRGLTSRCVGEKKAESHRTSHRNDVSLLTQGCTTVQPVILHAVGMLKFSHVFTQGHFIFG